MMYSQNSTRKPRAGFTLIELLCVITIIGLLAGMIFPVTQNIITRANDTKCMNNLRQIGIAANAAATDNDNRYPIIEIDEDGKIVEDSLGVDAKPLDEALKPYGITPETLKCPADLKGPNHYAMQNPHSSYMWSPYSEDNSSNAPTILSRRRGQGGTTAEGRPIPLSRLQLASDWSAVHSSDKLGGAPMIYAVYADGHVKTTRRSKTR